MVESVLIAMLTVLCVIGGILHITWPPWLRKWEGRLGWGSPDFADRTRVRSIIILFGCAFIFGSQVFTH